MNLNFSRGLKTARSVITANSPVLLVGAAVVGVVTTGVLAAKGGYKAHGIIDAAEADRAKHSIQDGVNVTTPGEPLTVQDKVKLTWLCYVPAALSGAATIASCLGVHLIHTKRQAALVAFYAMTASKLDDYQTKAEELLGTKKTQQLNDSLAQKTLDENPIDTSLITSTGGGTQLCLDMWTQRPFYSNMNKIDAVVNECNSLLIDEGDLDLNTFYDRIEGLEPIPMGNEYGWSGKQRLGITYGSAINKTGESVITISFRTDPKPNLGKR